MTWALRIFMLLYAIAVLLLLIGTYGWFGQEKDPLSGVFLMPLGLPWNFIVDRLGVPGLVSGLLAPAVNAAILYWLSKR